VLERRCNSSKSIKRGAAEEVKRGCDHKPTSKLVVPADQRSQADLHLWLRLRLVDSFFVHIASSLQSRYEDGKLGLEL